MAIQFSTDGDRVVFAIKVVPGASRDKIAGEYDGGLKVTVARAPENGAANRAVIDLLAKKLGIPRNQIEIIAGHTNPRKRVAVRGMSIESVQQKLG